MTNSISNINYSLAFQPIYEARTNKFYMFRQSTYIVYRPIDGLVKENHFDTK